MSQDLNVVFLGTTQNYGYAFAASNTKTEFMVRGLIQSGAHCTIINDVLGCSELKQREQIYRESVCDVITYPKRGNRIQCWIRNIGEVKRDLQRLFVKDSKNVVVLLSPDLHIYWSYVYLARKYGYRLVNISHEWHPTVKSIHPLRRPFSNLFTRTFGHCVDGILPISEYIIRKIQHFNKPYLKVPVLADYGDMVDSESASDYFVYCVYAAYTRVIFPLLTAYKRYIQRGNNIFRLVLVLAGDDVSVGKVRHYVDQLGIDGHVEIKQRLPYLELMDLYKGAAALIVPLDPGSEQDCARFSQKIAEYTSVAVPIITCKVGEVAHYFRDRQSAIMCDYSVDGFAQAFDWVSSHPEEALQIGKSGYEVGNNYFNYRVVGKQLFDFLIAL